MAFKIHGKVIEKETGKGIPNLTVKAIDKDLFFDDLLGAVTTDKNGNFEIRYDKEDFQELFFDKKPDIYIEIKNPEREVIYTTEDKVRYEAGETEKFNIKISKNKIKPKVNKHRDLKALEIVANFEESEESLDKILQLKRALKDAGYTSILQSEDDQEGLKAYCDSNVCVAIVCAFSSTCEGGACASNGCSALVDHCGFFSNSDPCENSKTCADKACGTGVSEEPDPDCGSKVCGFKSR